ncbi:MAG: MBOAT family protein [Verrucomicrobiaceae bacterium]|nr:MBOAT family protein [Verrucomicrobiaceae bacterium]
MLFNSFDFAVFILLVWLLHWAVRTHAWRKWILLSASLLFYGWWDWRFLPLLVGVSLMAWFCARGCGRALADNNPGLASRFTRLAVISSLLALGFFKYVLFALDALSDLAGAVGWNVVPPAFSIVLPVGISFYTFQALSYVIDVRRGKCEAEKSFLDVLFYIAFFPQLVAGPIVHAAGFMPQARTARRITPQHITNGVRLMIWGLMLKVVFGDALATWADPVFDAPLDYTLAGRWLGALAFAGQIYFDFAGYSTIAIGLGLTFGYVLPENFRTPYVAQSVTDFWRRWHISLSTWLRDYLFIPLGGNRSHHFRNLMITMVLGGLWHGASWNFVLWGGLHGLGLCVHKLWSKSARVMPSVPAWLLTQMFVLITWVPFRANDMKATLAFFTTEASSRAALVPACDITWLWLLIPLVLDALLGPKITALEAVAEQSSARGRSFVTGFSLGIALLMVFALGHWSSKAFIYFQF